MEETIEDKAFSAYYRRNGPNADCPSSLVEWKVHKHKDYLRLSNINGILAVYEVKEIKEPFPHTTIRFVSADKIPELYED
jgi:hypothetical protein